MADAYDAWIPVDERWPDDVVHRDVVARSPGPALELGCGTGRFLLQTLGDGLECVGLDESADMLAICRGHAGRLGLDPVLLEGSFAPLTAPADEGWGALVCPGGSFMLVWEQDAIDASLASYAASLRPGGELSLTLAGLPDESDADGRWRMRRSGTSGGTTYLVDECVHRDPESPVTRIYNRIAVLDETGEVTRTVVRRQHLRAWTPDEISERLERVGFGHIAVLGDDDGFVVRARR